MKGFKRTMAALIAAAMTMAGMIVPAMAETLNEITYTPVTELEKYRTAQIPNPWRDDSEYESSRHYHYWHLISESAMHKNEYDSETIVIYYVTNTGAYSITDFDENGWLEKINSIPMLRLDREERLTSMAIEYHNGVGMFRIDYIDYSDSPHTAYYIPSESGTIYQFNYHYSGEPAGIPQKYKQDFFDMMDTVYVKQKSSAPVTTNTPIPQPDIVTPSPVTADPSGRIGIYINGTQVYPDADPFIMNDRTMVPIRVIAETLGYTVSWDGPNQCVTMSKGNYDVQVMIDSTWITKYVDGQVWEYGFMDVAPCIYNDRTFIPLRAAAEAMGCAVDWDGSTRSVFISQ